ncbi:MAG: hypothetical protein IH945_03525 [Armatimonadetes bacterium]|nr:hypothetical protein [Armatimonadota bacterium]
MTEGCGVSEREYPPLDWDDTFPYGKHKGETLRDLVDEQPEYLVWIRDNHSTRFSEDVLYALKNYESGMEAV